MKQPKYQPVPPKPAWWTFVMEILVVIVIILGWRHGGKVLKETREGKRAGVAESESVLDFFLRD